MDKEEMYAEIRASLVALSNQVNEFKKLYGVSLKEEINEYLIEKLD